MYDNINPYVNNPPGSHHDIFAHPSGDNQRSIERALVVEHRFAFCYWMKWKNALIERNHLYQSAPTLITIDWHRDLGTPAATNEELDKLDQHNFSDVTNFVWARFNQNNDGHILAAVYLNLIGDIILLKHQGDASHDILEDQEGNEHQLFEFVDFSNFENKIVNRNDNNIFLDIDLDYFINGEVIRGKPDSFSLFSDREIENIVNPDNKIFSHIINDIDGITLALEPKFCGGLQNAAKLLSKVDSQLFTINNKWKHLS